MEYMRNYGFCNRTAVEIRHEELYYNNCLELEKMKEKEAIKYDAKLQILYAREEIRQKKVEDEKTVCETVAVGPDGYVTITTQNLWIEAKPRWVSNMRFLKLYIAVRVSDFNEKVLILICEVAGREQIVYLKPERIGSGTYILGKFAAAGIDILAPQGKEKQYARKLIALLVQQGQPAVLPEEPGWMELENDKFSFVEEGRMTWQKIKKLV